MKRLLSLILLISSFAGAMDAPATQEQEQKKPDVKATDQLPAYIYIEVLLLDKLEEGKLKKPEDCTVEQAIEQLRKIISSLRFGKDTNYCVDYEEIKVREKTVLIADLPILQNAFDQVIDDLLRYENGHVKKLVDRITQSNTKINLEETLESIKDIQLPPKVEAYLALQILNNNPQVRSYILKQINIPCLHTLDHTRPINSIAMSPDGAKVVTGSQDGTARIWDPRTGKCLHILRAHTRPVISVAISPDGTKIVTGSGDTTVRIWNTETGECLQTLTGHSRPIRSVAFSPDGTKIVTGSAGPILRMWDRNCLDGTAMIWDAKTGKCKHTLTGHAGRIFSVAFSPDGTKIVTGSQDGTARIWDAATGECLQTLNGHSCWVTFVAFSPDGTKIVTGSWDKTVRIWNIEIGEYLQNLNDHATWILSVAYSPDGKYLVTGGSRDGTAKVWDMRQFNTVLGSLTIPQALLLKEWYDAKQNQQQFIIETKQVKEVFDSLPKEIQDIIVQSNQTIKERTIISRITNYCYNHPWRTALGISAGAVATYGLYKYFKANNE